MVAIIWGASAEVDTSEHETIYGYDPNGKRVSASRKISPGTFQTRTYGFDARGNLLSASLPELGGVAISYKPDAIGLSWQTVDGEHDLTWSYDGNARPVSLENTTGALLWKEWSYGDSNDTSNKRQGRLIEAVRYNYPPGEISPKTASRFSIRLCMLTTRPATSSRSAPISTPTTVPTG